MSKIKFNLTPQEHIKEIKECGEKFTGSQYYCLYKEDIEKLVKYSEKRDKEIERLNNIINEFDSWLKEKKEQMEEFELYKRKETGAFWYSTMGNIETFIEKINELKGGSSNE